MLWAIHSSRAVVAAELREHLEGEMLSSLREVGIIPPAKQGDPEVTPERRQVILDAFTALGGPLEHVRPQMLAAISAAVDIAKSTAGMLGGGTFLVTLRGHHDAGRAPAQLVELSVSLAPETT
ncbi:MAG TPA: hypothetical protein VIU64_18640 [Polyangia bacterium]